MTDMERYLDELQCQPRAGRLQQQRSGIAIQTGAWDFRSTWPLNVLRNKLYAKVVIDAVQVCYESVTEFCR